MLLTSDSLEINFVDSRYGLSARRFWEFTELGQINVFGVGISSHQEKNNAEQFIDVIRISGSEFRLTGFTLYDLHSRRFPWGTNELDQRLALANADENTIHEFVNAVNQHILTCIRRQAVRTQPFPFLPKAETADVFGVPFIYSTLERSLRQMGNSKADADQWLATIENFRKKGLRKDEFERAELMPELAAIDSSGEKITAYELADLCNFSEIRLSVIPVVHAAQRQLHFVGRTTRKLKRVKRQPKAQTGQTRTLVGFDPVLGYRIEQIEHETLWGKEKHWQAVAHDGSVIANESKRVLLSSKQNAAAAAARHAILHFPKRVASGRWSRYAWSGGAGYREWLITLPHYWHSYFSSHFTVRNILAHVRCDVRDGPHGERILLLQEVQSDWAQNVRRDIRDGDMEPDDSEAPPFLKEWPALAMKLMLLHAAYYGLDGVAWIQGHHQVVRYKGLGAAGLKELYDRTLPREVNRAMRAFGRKCEMLGVFVPTNFSIRVSENGYDVFSADNEFLATAESLEDARQFIPEGGHESLYDVHGIRLDSATRQAILKNGFPAWG